MSRQIIVIAHNMRSTHNVGSLLRTAEGLGVSKLFLTGYTPYPLAPHDSRLPHEANKINKQISKTALGAETSQNWEHHENVKEVIKSLSTDGFTIAGLEQTPTAIELPNYAPPEKLVIILGEEVEGIPTEVLELTDLQLVIPMFGQKESFNVVQAAAMSLYHCTFA